MPTALSEFVGAKVEWTSFDGVGESYIDRRDYRITDGSRELFARRRMSKPRKVLFGLLLWRRGWRWSRRATRS